MSSFNKVILLGRLTRDPELRVTRKGNTICKLGIAVSRKYKDMEGEMKEEVTFVDVDSFGKQAEVVAKFFTKGKPILVEGRLKFDQWETQTGEKRSKLGVVMEGFQFVGGKDEGGAYSGGPSVDGYESVTPPARGSAKAVATSANDDLDEDVPF